ncbi:MAG: Uma2 family endonuclease, partial [Chloroflexota bacterium]
ETEYLTFEAESEIRHEFVYGKVYAMAGADWKHTMIAQSTSSTLYAQLRGTKCRVSSIDLRLKVDSKKVSYRYPDIMVICGDLNFAGERTDTITNPTLVIEVLSPSTALEDRNAKLDEYRAIDSVQGYLLVSVDQAKVELFWRGDDNKWRYDAVKGLENSIALPFLDCTLALADVYEQVPMDSVSDSEN